MSCWIIEMMKYQNKISADRTHRKTIKTAVKERSLSQTYVEELQPAAQQKYGTRTLKPSKPYCGTNCGTSKSSSKDKENLTSPSRTKYNSTSYTKEQNNPVANKSKFTNPTKIKEKVKFSRQFNPSPNSKDSGFIPIPSPFKGNSPKTTPSTTAQRRTKYRSVDELTVKESRPNPNILGNGHFEILKGGIFSDHETNEIPGGGRRVGRTFEPYAIPQYRQVPYEVVQYPSMYRDPRVQLPTHPMFFPRAAYSENSEMKMMH